MWWWHAWEGQQRADVCHCCPRQLLLALSALALARPSFSRCLESCQGHDALCLHVGHGALCLHVGHAAGCLHVGMAQVWDPQDARWERQHEKQLK